MRYLPLVALVGLGCVTTSVARLSPDRYEARSRDTAIPFYSSKMPTCSFREIAIVKARRDTWLVGSDAAVNALRNKARNLGGDALVRVEVDHAGWVTGTVIRFERDDCRE
jgi:hypothetical protein